MAVESTGFRFYTRTRSEDYRVFADEGRELRNKNDFLRLRNDIAGCSNEDDEGAAVFEDRGMIHLVAFGFMRGDMDRGNRTKRFSFCRVYPKSQARLALNALARIAEDWDGTAEFANSLIEEVPVMRKTEFEDFKGKERRSEDVRFDRVRFLQWLGTPAVNPIPPSYASALRAGNMLKYFRNEIFPVPMGTENEEGDDDLPGLRDIEKENKPGKLSMSIILAVLCVVFGIGCAMLGVWLKTEMQNVSELERQINQQRQRNFPPERESYQQGQGNREAEQESCRQGRENKEPDAETESGKEQEEPAVREWKETVHKTVF